MSIRPGRVALLVALFAVAVGVAAWSGQSWTPASEPMADEPRQVIVFGMAPLGFRDLEQGDTPVLDRLLEEGAVGAMSTRTGSRVSTPEEGYLAIGAGSRVRVAAGAGVAYEAAEQLPNGGTGATLFQEATGRPLEGGIGAAGAVASVRRNDGSAVRSHPGALGQALREAGRSAAVVSNSDTVDAATGATIVDRPGVLALMDEGLAVDDGIVAGGRLLVEDPTVPFGRKADADAVVSAVERMAATHDVVLVDPGELARAAAYERHVTEEQEGRVRAHALRRTDDILGRVLPLADEDTVLLVVSVAAGGDGLRLAPVVAVGGGLEPGYLVSPSVKRSGL
ncbi:MAG TPA: hypothetical protein VJ804_16220, partial [Acidimicrobiales bacterium]|nr:hypothetical protein [Acidimicrobiales bacterium]